MARGRRRSITPIAWTGAALIAACTPSPPQPSIAASASAASAPAALPTSLVIARGAAPPWGNRWIGARPDGRIALDGLRVYDPSAESFSTDRPEPHAPRGLSETAGDRSIQVQLRNGTLVDLAYYDTPGALVLIDPAGKRTPLAGSMAYIGPSSEDGPGPSYRCFAAKGGSALACQRFDKNGRNFVAIWDARSGRRVIERRGDTVVFSPDDTTLLVETSTENSLDHALVDVKSGREIASFRHPSHQGESPSAAWAPAGASLALDFVGLVDGRTGKVLWEHALAFPRDGWLIEDRIVTHREKREYRGKRSLGRIEVRDVRTGAVRAQLDEDLEAQAAGGALLLTVDADGNHRVRDARSLAERAHIGPADHAVLSPDGRFLYAQGEDALQILRLADGATITQILPEHEGQRGLSYTAGGLFDGGPEALGRVQIRVGDPASGKLLRWDEVQPSGRRPGLAVDFFAGRSIAPGPKG